MAFVLSESEEMNLPSSGGAIAERKAQEEQLLKQAQAQIEKQVKDSLEGEKKAEQEKLRAIMEENERLRVEKERLEKQNKQPPEDLLK